MLNQPSSVASVVSRGDFLLELGAEYAGGVWIPCYQIFCGGRALSHQRRGNMWPRTTAYSAIQAAATLAAEDIRLGIFDWDAGMQQPTSSASKILTRQLSEIPARKEWA